MASRGRLARFHRARPLPGARMDRVDAGVSVRLRAPAVRRHRRRRLPRPRARPHPRAHVGSPHARRRPRSRVQQREHLREPVAPRARGTDPRDRLGDAFLRAGAESQRRRAGAPVDEAAATAGSSIRSTAPTRCSSTRSDRCGRSHSATCSASASWRSRTHRSTCSIA